MSNEVPKEGYKIECPRNTCRSKCLKKIVYYNDGSNNIDGLAYYDLECPECSLRFLEWGCDIEKLKKAFGDNWKQYV